MNYAKLIKISLFLLIIHDQNSLAASWSNWITGKQHELDINLLYATNHMNHEDIQRYLHKGANPNAQYTNINYSLRLHDNYDIVNTALLNAVNNNDCKAVKNLLSSQHQISKLKTNPNIQTLSTGMTPLGLATSRGYISIAIILINNGADLRLKNKNGDTALDLAVHYDHWHIAELLTKKGINPHNSFRCSRTQEEQKRLEDIYDEHHNSHSDNDLK